MRKSRKLALLYTTALAIVLIAMMLLRPRPSQEKPTGPRDFPEIQSEGILRVVTEYSPSGYYVSGDTLRGFQYELCRAIARLSGLEVRTHLEMSLTQSFEGLADNTYDVIARNIPVTTEARADYLFTDPIVLNKQILVQRTAKANLGIEPIRDQLDLAGKTLYVSKDSPALLRLRNLGHEIGDTIYVVEDSLYVDEQLMIMVAKGDIDYAVCDRRIAQQLQEKLPEVDIQTDISFTQLQSWAVRESSPILLDSLNSWLRQLRDNGEYDLIYQRYYP